MTERTGPVAARAGVVTARRYRTPGRRRPGGLDVSGITSAYTLDPIVGCTSRLPQPP